MKKLAILSLLVLAACCPPMPPPYEEEPAEVTCYEYRCENIEATWQVYRHYKGGIFFEFSQCENGLDFDLLGANCVRTEIPCTECPYAPAFP